MKRFWTVATAVAVLSGCASGPELLVEQAPAGPAQLQGLSLLTGASDEAALAAVSRTLSHDHGVTTGEDWDLVVTLSRRPVVVGSFSDTDAREGAWTETPRIVGARRGPGLHVLSIVARRADGSDQRLVRVSARGPLEQTDERLLQVLAEAAASALVKGHQTGAVQ